MLVSSPLQGLNDYEKIVRDMGPVFYAPLLGTNPDKFNDSIRGTVPTMTGVTNTLGGALIPGPAHYQKGANASLQYANNAAYDISPDVGSWSLWYRRVGGGDGTQILFVKGSAFSIYVVSAGNTIRLNANGLGDVYVGPAVAAGGPWRHIVFTKNGSGVSVTVRLWINGAETSGGAYTNRTFGTGGDIAIGNNPSSVAADVIGHVIHAAAFPRVLTPGEVRYLWEAGASLFNYLL